MKKFPRKFQYPLMASLVLPTMLLGMSAIMTYQNLPEGASFLNAWMNMVGQVVPPALLLLAVIAPSVRLFVSRVLLEPEQQQTDR
ncbi:hypothetical protein [Marinobacter sp. V034]|uniref:hypothetical protein n=1 Tax=Marinobacter TaxID=2742 RepID=UPI004044A515